MSYEPTTWKDGDLVTSAKLNKMEQGIVNATSSGATSPTANLVAIMTSDTLTLNKTWQEIYDENISVIIGEYRAADDVNRTFLPIINMGTSMSQSGHIGWITADNSGSIIELIASTTNDYPRMSSSS